MLKPKTTTLHLQDGIPMPIIAFKQEVFSFSSKDIITELDVLGLVATAAQNGKLDDIKYFNYRSAYTWISKMPETIHTSVFKCYIKMEMELNAGNIGKDECNMITHFVTDFADKNEGSGDFFNAGSIEVKLWKDLDTDLFNIAVNLE